MKIKRNELVKNIDELFEKMRIRCATFQNTKGTTYIPFEEPLKWWGIGYNYKEKEFFFQVAAKVEGQTITSEITLMMIYDNFLIRKPKTINEVKEQIITAVQSIFEIEGDQSSKKIEEETN